MSDSPLPPSRTMTDVLSLPDLERSLVNWIMRENRATFAQCVVALEQPIEVLQTVLPNLVAEGFLRCADPEIELEEQVYEPAMRTRRNRRVPKAIWDALN